MSLKSAARRAVVARASVSSTASTRAGRGGRRRRARHCSQDVDVIRASPRWTRRRAAARSSSAAPGCAATRSLYSAIARVSSRRSTRSAEAIALPRREAGHDLAVPEHVVGDEQAAGTQQRHEPIEHRHVQLLVAVLKNQSRTARPPSRSSAARRRRSRSRGSASPARLEILAALRVRARDPFPSSSASRRAAARRASQMPE